MSARLEALRNQHLQRKQYGLAAICEEFLFRFEKARWEKNGRETIPKHLKGEKTFRTSDSIAQLGNDLRDAGHLLPGLLLRNAMQGVPAVEERQDITILSSYRMNVTILFENRELVVTETEYDLLNYMHKNHDRIISTREFVENVWGGMASLDAVRMNISRLRTKLGEDKKT